VTWKNKEIKFRAWIPDKKEMIKVDALVLSENVFRDYRVPHILDEHNDIYDLNGVFLMQYTGCKDRDGKEIYEGDVLQVLDDFLGIVRFKDGCHYLVLLNGDNDYASCLCLRNYNVSPIKIVGNIFENPEIVEQYSPKKQT